MSIYYYSHPSGDIPLQIHPDKPWRVVAYLNGLAIMEMDKPADWDDPEPAYDIEDEELQDEEPIEDTDIEE